MNQQVQYVKHPVDGSSAAVISKEYLEWLRNRDLFLQALENAGVDNWDGMEHAQDIYNGWDRQ